MKGAIQFSSRGNKLSKSALGAYQDHQIKHKLLECIPSSIIQYIHSMFAKLIKQLNSIKMEI